MKNKSIWDFIEKELKVNNPVVLILIAESTGFTPGKTGFKLAYSASGRLFGTIGGGQIEYEMIEKAKEIIETKTNQLINYSLANTLSESNEGMICGGNNSIVMSYLSPNNISIIESIKNSIKSNVESIIKLSFIDTIQIEEKSDIKFNKIGLVIDESNNWSYTEEIGVRPIIHIIGGGHVCLALSRILATLNYQIIVYDERENIDTINNNSYADKIINVPFSQAHELIEDSPYSHIIIMTPGHLSDELVLKNTIKKHVKYIGMMASIKKRNEIYSNLLRTSDINQKDIDKVHCPIGIPIKSNTPEEIAVSIAAEIIKVNNEHS